MYRICDTLPACVYTKYLLVHKVDLFPIYATQTAISSVYEPKN
jgi:hypothetical protein